VEALINKCDETLPTINKSKHPKKGEYKGRKKGRTHIQEDKRSTKKGQTTKEHPVHKPPTLIRSISNNERGGPPKRTPSLEEASSITTVHFKIKIIQALCDVIDTFSL
jgi:hypothetical protein